MPTSISWACRVSHNLNFSNRPVRTRMPGGVGGVEPIGSLLSRLHKSSELFVAFQGNHIFAATVSGAAQAAPERGLGGSQNQHFTRFAGIAAKQ